MKFIGFYTPVGRCLQTSFALTMGQLLAKDHPTLYVNFEPCAGLGQLLPDMNTKDLADLLFFLLTDCEKFKLRMQSMLSKIGELDYIPPMRVGQNLLSVTSNEWMQLLQKIEEMATYEYVILDLSDCVQGLFEILRSCEKVFLLTTDEDIAKGKVLQYEHVLQLYAYDDVNGKTKKCTIPKIRHLPNDFLELTKGELADFVWTQLNDGKCEENIWTTEN